MAKSVVCVCSQARASIMAGNQGGRPGRCGQVSPMRRGPLADRGHSRFLPLCKASRHAARRTGAPLCCPPTFATSPEGSQAASPELCSNPPAERGSLPCPIINPGNAPEAFQVSSALWPPSPAQSRSVQQTSEQSPVSPAGLPKLPSSQPQEDQRTEALKEGAGKAALPCLCD